MGRERPPFDRIPVARQLPKLLQLLKLCWQHEPQRRPAAAEIVKHVLLARERVRTDARAGGMLARLCEFGGDQQQQLQLQQHAAPAGGRGAVRQLAIGRLSCFDRLLPAVQVGYHLGPSGRQ